MKNFFETEYKVIVSDINYGGHMGNERALIIFQQTRMEWLNSIGYDEADIEGKISAVSQIILLRENKRREIRSCLILQSHNPEDRQRRSMPH